MSRNTYNRVVSMLTEAKVQFVLKEHEPTHSSEQSAAVRGTPLKAGAKAIILKLSMRDGSSAFANFVVGANRKVDTKAILALLNAKKARFATAEELHELTGLVPGSVPPVRPPASAFRPLPGRGPASGHRDGGVQRWKPDGLGNHVRRGLRQGGGAQVVRLRRVGDAGLGLVAPAAAGRTESQLNRLGSAWPAAPTRGKG